MSDEVAFFIWCRNDEEWLHECLSTFRQTTPNIHLLGIANECTDSTVDILRSYGAEIVSFVEHHSTSCCVNLGYSILANRGFQYIGWIHPDCKFNHPGWVEALRTELDHYPQIARLCAWNEKDDERKKEHPHIYPGAEAANLIHVSLLSLVGPYDEAFLGSAYEDWDMQRRIIEKGLATCVTKSATIWHQHAGTRSKYDAYTRQQEWTYNEQLYFSKWGDKENKFAPDGFMIDGKIP